MGSFRAETAEPAGKYGAPGHFSTCYSTPYTTTPYRMAMTILLISILGSRAVGPGEIFRPLNVFP